MSWWRDNSKEIARINAILEREERPEQPKPVREINTDLDIAIRKLEVDLRKYAIQNVIRIGVLNMNFDLREMAKNAVKNPEAIAVALNSLAKDLRNLGLDVEDE